MFYVCFRFMGMGFLLFFFFSFMALGGGALFFLFFFYLAVDIYLFFFWIPYIQPVYISHAYLYFVHRYIQ